MLNTQLGRRNLSPIQRIAVAEKYRSIYEKQALANKQAAMQEARKNNEKKLEQFPENSSTTVNGNKVDVRAKLAKTTGVFTDIYSKGKKNLLYRSVEICRIVFLEYVEKCDKMKNIKVR